MFSMPEFPSGLFLSLGQFQVFCGRRQAWLCFSRVAAEQGQREKFISRIFSRPRNFDLHVPTQRGNLGIRVQ